jgi:hypothetical protein
MDAAKTSKGLESAVRARNSAIDSFHGRLISTVRRIGERGIAEAARVAEPPLVETAAGGGDSGEPDAGEAPRWIRS